MLSKSTKDKINQNAYNCTRFIDTAGTQAALGDFTVTALPTLEKVNFYGDYKAPEHDYMPASSKTLAELEEQRREGKIREAVELEGLMSGYDRGQITFVGPAGSGKTTMLNEITRRVLEGKYPHLKDVELVHFVQCREFETTDKVTTGKFLYSSVEPQLTENEVDEAIRFTKANPQKVLFILDSLDTLRFTAEGRHPPTSTSEQAAPGTILYNFLAGRLFPNCRIITSSREHAIRNYAGPARAENVIAMMGFTIDSIKQVMVGYLGETEAEEIMNFFEEKSPLLLNLCATPAFLTFTLVGFKGDGTFKPSTMTGVLMLLLSNFYYSEQFRATHSVTDIENLLSKLKKLAFIGTKEKRVLFDEEEFQRYQLSTADVADLVVQAPGGQLTQKLMRGKKRMFFSHQSIQELLAAMYIAEMPVSEFQAFLTENIHTPHYALVRRILCGTLLDYEVQEQASPFLSDLERTSKTNSLLASLKDELAKNLSKGDKLELYISLSEARDGAKEVIESRVTSVEVRDTPLSPMDVQAVAFIVSKCEELNAFRLCQCGLSARSFNIIAASLERANVKIRNLNFSGNKDMGVDGASAIGRIARHCNVRAMALMACHLTSERLEAFKEHIGDATLTALTLSNNDEMGVGGLSAVGQLAKQCSVKQFTFRACNLLPNQLTAFRQGLDSAKLDMLSLWDNRNMGVDGFSTLGQIAEECLFEKFYVVNCNISSSELEAFEERLQTVEFDHVGFSGEGTVNSAWISAAGKIIEKCQIKRLYLKDINLTSEQLRTFIEVLGTTEMQELWLDDKRETSGEDIPAVVDLFKNVTNVLYLSNWKIKPGDVQFLHLKLKLHGTELKVHAGEQILHKDTQRASVTEIENKVPSDASAEFLVSPEGGNYEVDGCSISFPSGALAVDTSHSLSAAYKEEIWEEGLIPITPIFTCSSTVSPALHVKIQLPVWCNTSSDVTVRVLALGSEAAATPKEVSTVPLKTVTNKLEFEYSDVGKFRGFIRSEDFGEVTYDLSIGLYQHYEGFLSAAFCPRETRLAMQQTMASERSLTIPGELSSISVVDKDEIEASIEYWGQENYLLGDGVLRNFAVDTEFGRNPFRVMKFAFTPIPPKQHLLKMAWRIRKSNSLTECTQFAFKWGITSYKMGPGGGDIDVEGYRISFPPGAVSQETQFNIHYGLPHRPWDEDFLPVTPELTCEPSVTFSSPVRIQLPLWCTTESDKVEVHVMQKTDDDAAPEVITRKLLKNMEGMVEFECTHFSGFWAFIKWLFFGDVVYTLKVNLIHHRGGNVACVLYPPDMRQIVEEERVSKNFLNIPGFHNPVTVKRGDVVEGDLKCRDVEYETEEERRKFEVNKDFGKYPVRNLNYIIKPTPEAEKKLTLEWQMLLNSEPIKDNKIVANVTWGEKPPKYEPMETTRIVRIATNFLTLGNALVNVKDGSIRATVESQAQRD